MVELPAKQRMRVTVEFPVDGSAPDLLTKAGLSRVVRRADALGFDALAFTDHPAPTVDWLQTRAGHETLDVITALSFCAAITERIRLMTYLLVVPYRNPFLAAKSLATVDRLSDGRLDVAAGAGYLAEEFEALGVSIEDRNAIFDEGLEVMRAAWTGEPVDRAGLGFVARGVVQRPVPAQPNIPIIIGGNSRSARERAARNRGWSPIVATDDVADSIRTAGLTLPQLADRVREVRSAADDPESFLVQAHTPHAYVLRRDLDAVEHREHVAALLEAGVDSMILKLPNSSVTAAIRGLERYTELFR